MATIITYVILVATVVASLCHTLLTDPNAAGILTPAVKGVVGVVAVIAAMLLDSLPRMVKQEKVVMAARRARKLTPPPMPLLVLALTLGACTPSAQSVGSTVALGIKDTLCVIDHDNEPVLQIIADCNLAADAGTAVQQILERTHAREELARRGMLDAGVVPHFVDAGAGK